MSLQEVVAADRARTSCAAAAAAAAAEGSNDEEEEDGGDGDGDSDGDGDGDGDGDDASDDGGTSSQKTTSSPGRPKRGGSAEKAPGRKPKAKATKKRGGGA